MEYKVINNFLDKDFFKFVQNIIMAKEDKKDVIAYFFNNTIAHTHDKVDHYYFTHIFYQNDQPISDYYFSILKPILKKLDIKTLIGAKINLYPRTHKIIHHTPHKDYPYPHKGCVFSINTCDGYTLLQDKKIPSIENQALLFDSSIEHSSTSCTNAQARFNININYF